MSNETKHTPGPWTLGKGKVRVRTLDGVLVAECYTTKNWNKYPDEAQREANAALIVAAPEMLQALKDARNTIQHWGDYAEEYFQKKHDLAGDLAAIDNLISRIENN